MTADEDLETFRKFQKEDLNKYKGKWITVSSEYGVVSADEELKKAVSDFKEKFPEKEPFVFKVPRTIGLTVF